ncbi:MAG: putative (di)nucleoside polyphosphate hydrolase [Marinobacter sp. T13-3]|nr:MAG: putative (di)nucleoside polyphosphate hydrolase [Marinobacter sp. T13-3]
MIDSDGFRPNVGIILANHRGEVLWARRIGQDSWQFPQGGIKDDESPEEALYRELAEEIGLSASDVEIISCTRGWLRYRLPRRMVRYHSHPVCVGQKQKWFLLRMLSPDAHVRVDGTDSPEFDGWATGIRWGRWSHSKEKCTGAPCESLRPGCFTTWSNGSAVVSRAGAGRKIINDGLAHAEHPAKHSTRGKRGP